MIIFGVSNAHAHDSRPLFIQVEETSQNIAHLTWKTPPSIQPQHAPLIILSSPCTAFQKEIGAQRLSGSTFYNCPDGVADIELHITYPLYNPSISSLVRIKFISGEQHTNILTPSLSKWHIPARETFLITIKNYFSIGVRHILSGYDHLLFLAGLLYIARKPRRVLITITGFTIAHSLTIFLVALNLVRVSVSAIETIIALSIVFLAYEIVRNDRSTLTWRKPALVAAAFGLAHGAGFAVALSEIGLPQTEKIVALLFFNLGVEAGQLAVFASIVMVGWMIKRFAYSQFSQIDPMPYQRAFGYGLGILSALWFFQRLTLALS